METSLHVPLKVSYFPAFAASADLAFYKRQADWYLAPLKKRAHISFPENATQAQNSANAADIIFFWKKEAFWNARPALRRKGLVVDEYAEQAVGDKLDAFIASHVTPDFEGHKEVFISAIKGRHPELKRSIIIGSGPNISEVADLSQQELRQSLSIYLSTAVLNEPLCKACPPGVIIAVDGPSQFGPSETAARYRKRVAELVRRYQSLILVPAQHLPSIRAHWPADIQASIFAVPLVRTVKAGHKFSKDWAYEPTSNVLTSFGLPCAASFTDNIALAGISVRNGSDGPRPEGHHWAHLEEAQYQRHVAPMLAAHPASGQDNSGYLDRHHARLNRELSAYHAAGFRFDQLGIGPVNIAPMEVKAEAPPNPSLKVRVFETIAKAEHYPERITLAVFIIFGLLGLAAQYVIGKEMMGFLIAGGLAAFLVAGLLFLRLRQSRLSARLESKLSQQQAQQFANLSARLEALERQE